MEEIEIIKESYEKLQKGETKSIHWNLNQTGFRSPSFCKSLPLFSRFFCNFFASGFDERKQVLKFEEFVGVLTRKNTPLEPDISEF